jgi:putative spermidine/putrescine transport system permease protein
MTTELSREQAAITGPGDGAAPASSSSAPHRRRRWRASLPTVVLMLPAAVALTLLFFWPLVQIAYLSVTQPEVGFDNYVKKFTDGYTVTILLRTVWVSFIVAVVTTALAFPFAYAMTICSPLTRAILFTIVLIPFWTNSTAKNFVFLALFQRDGVIDSFLQTFGIHYPLIGTAFGVTIAMSQVLLPFAVLPLYASLGQIDRRLLDAAVGLGATRTRAFFRVYLPLSAPGLSAGLILVFVLSLGFYVTPAMLGSPQQAMIAQLIMTRVQLILDLGGAGAIGIFLLVVTMLSLGLSRLIAGGRARGTNSLGGIR